MCSVVLVHLLQSVPGSIYGFCCMLKAFLCVECSDLVSLGTTEASSNL